MEGSIRFPAVAASTVWIFSWAMVRQCVSHIHSVPGTRQATDLIVTDFRPWENVDILATSLSVETFTFLRGLGNPAFAPRFFAGQSPIAVKVVDRGSRIALPVVDLS